MNTRSVNTTTPNGHRAPPERSPVALLLLAIHPTFRVPSHPRMNTQRHKYHDKIAHLRECPPETCVARRITLFRFVYEDPTDSRNFRPPFEIKPRRALGAQGTACCSGYALSMFITDAMAEAFYKERVANHQNMQKTIGPHLATGIVDPSDGLAGEPRSDGHVEFHELHNSDVGRKFTIVRKLG